MSQPPKVPYSLVINRSQFQLLITKTSGTRHYVFNVEMKSLTLNKQDVGYNHLNDLAKMWSLLANIYE